MRFFSYDTIVIGSGAAGFNAACRLKRFDTKSVAMVTEGTLVGTSRNTGSDKQTYYKLGLGGDAPDSVSKMAGDLFAGGCVDGDNALCEAALSARSFLHLCELGVPFPVNRYGEYVGYKTDHDPYARATSAGPLTSKFMTEALEKEAEELGLEIFDGYLAIEILKEKNQVIGLLCLEIKTGEPVAFRCGQVVMATGGPAGIYADSVYPACHTGTTGLALLAGAKTQNLTEWQYGLASVNPRWNVSGTYMQVLPRFLSIDDNGTEYEFLAEYFEDPYEALSMVFLKGYQWPFDSKKVLEGSSVIDLLVYRECVFRKRKVYLDYTKNPFGLVELDYSRLSEEANSYLTKAGAVFGTPIARLLHMNKPAVELYAGKGLDIQTQYLEIALCAQHNNGGIAVDLWWQTSVEGLFAVGECAGTHGVARPGGSALNAGQVGSLRAAQYICARGKCASGCTEDTVFDAVLSEAIQRHKETWQTILCREDNTEELIKAVRRRMSDNGAAIRDFAHMQKALAEVLSELCNVTKMTKVSGKGGLYLYYKLKDTLLTQAAVLTALTDYAKKIGKSRGSALYTDQEGMLRNGLEEVFRFKPASMERADQIQEVALTDGKFTVNWRPVRPMPDSVDFFENIWRTYRENGNIY